MLTGLGAILLQAQASVGAVASPPQVELMVLREVSTRDAKPGMPVLLRLNKPLRMADGTLVPEGTPAFGTVEAKTGSGVALRRGSLRVAVTHLDFRGRRIALSGQADVRGRGGRYDDLAKVILVPFYAPFAQGNSAKLRAGELLTATVADAPTER